MSPSRFKLRGSHPADASAQERLRALSRWAASWVRPPQALYLGADHPEQAFEAWCRAHPGMPVRLIFSGGLTHQRLVPAPAQRSALSRISGQQAAAARSQAAQDFALHHGELAQGWPMATWSAGGWDGACALHGVDVAALRRSAQTHGVRLQSAVPLWSALLPWLDASQPQWCSVDEGALDAEGAGTPTAALAVIEGTLLTWLPCGNAQVHGVMQRRLRAPTLAALDEKIHSLRAGHQRVYVAGFGLDAQPASGQAAWQALMALDNSALSEAVLKALVRP